MLVIGVSTLVISFKSSGALATLGPWTGCATLACPTVCVSAAVPEALGRMPPHIYREDRVLYVVDDA